MNEPLKWMNYPNHVTLNLKSVTHEIGFHINFTSIIKTKKNMNMKTVNKVLTSAVVVASLVACESANTEANKNADKVIIYVDSIQNLTPEYTSAYWSSLDKGYQDRVVVVQADMDKLDTESRAKLDESIAKYNALKASYENNIREREQALASASADYKIALRNSLFGEGVIGSDMQFNYVTGKNLYDVYKRFVNSVQDNKDKYSREDWDEIKVLWEALDTRKNVVEKDAPNGDNTRIGALKIKFGTIKALNRPGTKAEENKEAKEKS